VRCCGHLAPTISVTASTGELALRRCTTCGDQRWERGGVPVPREQAFDALASAYREGPLRARAARDRVATATAARQAARIASAAAARAEAPVPARPDPASVLELLQGWTVLGASA